MKTVIIFETFEETALYVVDGDLTKFEGVYINESGTATPELEDELCRLVLGDIITTAQAREYIVNGAALVHCGHL